jgi:hypothetical protein
LFTVVAVQAAALVPLFSEAAAVLLAHQHSLHCWQ